MSRSRNKGWIVSISHKFSGPAGKFILDFQLRQRRRIKDTAERQRLLGAIPDEELVLQPYAELKSLDPNHWKDQDHYAVLGLHHIRHRATQDQIRRAYRKAVLKHHPDKRRRKGEKIDHVNDSDDYFTCITRANEVLGTLDSQRSYDSIDPNFDDDIPSVNKQSREKFFEVFGPVFELNCRWSVDPEVPFLGDEWSTIEEVDTFYSFWYNFNSWREYSYLDEENKEKAEDAYERRWMEKQNRAARATRKKEENQRIRQLVDNAYTCDPRLKRYKEEEKRRKRGGRGELFSSGVEKKTTPKDKVYSSKLLPVAVKQRMQILEITREEEKAAKADAIRKANEEKLAEERRIEQQKEDERKREEEEKRQKQAELKKEKEKEKRLLKKERQKLKAFCKKNNHFRDSEAAQLEMMDRVNHLCVALDLLKLQKLNEGIEAATSKPSAQELVENQLKKLQDDVEKEKRKHLDSAASKNKNGVLANGAKDAGGKAWSYEDLQVLIKAVNLFPAGTNNRWDTVATYINTHASVKTRTGKDCLARAKNLKSSDLKAEANQKAFTKFQEKHAADAIKATPSDENITQRFDGPRPWSSDEQKLLEQALKTYPSSTAQRWDKIAESVSSRTKKECMVRYKELVEMVKAKKAISQQSKKA